MAPADTSTDARQWFRLRPTVFAPRLARKFVYEVGDPAELPEGLVDDAAFIVGELVSESIRQSRREVEVVIELASTEITVRVRDAHASAPLLKDIADEAPARSSAAIRQLAASWGCCPYLAGWEIWAVMRARQTDLA
jgi:hypothetical protein